MAELKTEVEKLHEIEKALRRDLEELGSADYGDMEREIEMELEQMEQQGELRTEPVSDRPHDITVKGLYDVAVQSMIRALDTMKAMPGYHDVNQFYRLHHISMTLQHWEDDINRSESDKSDKWNPLSNVERAGGVFQDIAISLRRSLTEILRAQNRLQSHLKDQTEGTAQPSTRSDPCNPCIAIIDTITARVHGLKICVRPLRVLSDRNRGIGLASAIKKRSELLRPSERLGMDGYFSRSQFDGRPREFLPAGVVDELISPERRDELVLELEAGGSDQEQALADYIIGMKAKKLLIIALNAFENDIAVEAMEIFREKGIHDSHLPFLDREQRKLRGPNTAEKVALEDLDSEFWGSRSRRFYNAQWEVLVPRFSVGQVSKDLDQSAILPFIEIDPESKVGGFGEVRKIKIHERHIEDPDDTFEELPEYYALKHIKPDKTEDDIMHFWEKEATNLQAMMGRKVKHAVRFVTAFRRACDIEATKWNHYLICEWADGGSLNDVWKRNPDPALNASLVREVVVQLLGLADALVEAHYPPKGSSQSFMRHGDLKPDNILCFTGEGVIGTLKIGDWGLAKQKNFATMDQLMKSSRPGATVRYVSPETLTGIVIKGITHNDKRTRLQDTWAMGCMVLELIMWMLYGFDYVNKFYERLNKSGKLNISGNDAPFWEESLEMLGKKTAKVATIVTEEMDKIAKDSRCGTDPNATAIAALLDLVRTRLLVVALPKNLGQDDETKDSGGTLRPSLKTLSRRSTIVSDEDRETIAGTPTDSPSRAHSPVSTEGHDNDASQVNPSGEDDESPRSNPDLDSAVKSIVVPDVIVEAPPEIFVDEPLEEGLKEPEISASSNEADPVTEEEDSTARARAKELRNKLNEIVQKGYDDDTGRYWFTDNLKEDEGKHRQAATVPATEPQFGTGSKPPADSGYASGFSGTTAVSTSSSDWKTTTTTYTSSSGTGMSQQSIRIGSTGSSSLPQQTGGLLSAPKDTRLLDYTFPILDESWIFHVDNRFATSYFSRIQDHGISAYPDVTPPSGGTGPGMVLCEDCELLRVWEVGFSVQYPVDKLRQKALACGLCRMFWEAAEKHKATGLANVSFVRDQSWLKLNGSGPPVLSLLRDPYLDGPLDLQMGLPFRLDVNSPAHFEMMRQWLQVCETSHKHPPQSPEMLSSLPTRLIDVGQEGDRSARLREVEDPDFEPGKYIALSHPWGNPPHFCTFRTNLARHKQAIQLDELPPVFRDAVITTRALGVRYLWIDSICIIQGPEGDFDKEARRMEQVFSAALCVIAASSSSGQFDGWLDKREEAETKPRAFVSLRYLPVGSNARPRSSSEDKTEHTRSIYICEAIDDFASDVLQSPLSRRGWVLQERALARRTIFFTKNQTYFECGDGVRCMTLAKMKNSLAALLGDTAFPQIMMSATKGERIVRYQDFYRNYSRLGLTRDYDRPIAIGGLQSRLLKAFNTQGGFGIFDEGPQPRARGHLRRSLLWHRGDDVDTLERIEFPPSSNKHDDSSGEASPPSWSWMAYTGGIDYLQLEFDGVDWAGGINTPWWPPKTESIFNKKDGIRRVTLEGLAQNFTFGIDGGREIGLTVTPASAESANVAGGAGSSDETDRGRIIFDMPRKAEDIPTGQIRCVVLGRTSVRRPGSGQRTVYVLVVAPLEAKEASSYSYQHAVVSSPPELWERIGAGYLPESCVDASSAPMRIRIV